MLTGRIVRASRALLGWSQIEMAEKCEIGVSAIRRIEAIDGVPKAYTSTLQKIETRLLAEGITFDAQQDHLSIQMDLHSAS